MALTKSKPFSVLLAPFSGFSKDLMNDPRKFDRKFDRKLD